MPNHWLTEVVVHGPRTARRRADEEGRQEVRRSVLSRHRRRALLVLTWLLAFSWLSPASPPNPVVAPEDLIVGRALDDDVVELLTESRRLIRIGLDDDEIAVVRLQVEDQDNIWGLARSRSGELWTLLNRQTLARISKQGVVERRIPLARSHIGLFSLNGSLVYQALPRPSQPLLSLGPPGDTGRAPITGFEARVRTANVPDMLIENLVMCGAGTAGVLPCWFPDDVVLHLIGLNASSQRLDLPALAWSGHPDSQHPSVHGPEDAAQPIWDAYIDKTSLWVLSGLDQLSIPARKGGLRLIRFGVAGDLIAEKPLATPARLILGTRGKQVWLLLTSGSLEKVALP
jgi:hypothetical protein